MAEQVVWVGLLLVHEHWQLHRRNRGTTGGITEGGCGVGGPSSAIFVYVVDCVTRNKFNSTPNNVVTD